jgi:hypothetical protein
MYNLLVQPSIVHSGTEPRVGSGELREVGTNEMKRLAMLLQLS